MNKKYRLLAFLLALCLIMTSCSQGSGNNATQSPAASTTPEASIAPTKSEEPTKSEAPSASPSEAAKELYPLDLVTSKVEVQQSESKEFSQVFEAEDGVVAGDIAVATQRAGFSGSGYITGFSQKPANKWSLEIEIPYTQYYKITTKASADSYKENFLTLDGKSLGTIVCSGERAFEEFSMEGIYIEAGKHTLSVTESWGWFDLDSITIATGSSFGADLYNGVSSKLVNPQANEKTQRIMNYIVDNYGKNIISGQYTNHGFNTEVEVIKRETGHYPALRGFDFIFMSPNSGYQSLAEMDQAIDWSKKGGLLSFSWHWHAPIKEGEFYTKDTKFKLADAVTEIDLSMLSLEEAKALWDKGDITEEAYKILSDIDVISGHLKTLEENNVTVLWRPLHEASGGWFWWGGSGSDSFLWLYKLMFNRQMNYHKLSNIIWVWNGQNKDWYPGDEYVDIIGEDIYADKHDYGSQVAKLGSVAQYTTGKKVIALSENGVIPDPDNMIRDNAMWSYFNTWCREFIVDDSFQLIGDYTSDEMVNKMFNHERVITLDELPRFE